jgi:4-nitrophenyl phosphatase
MEFSQIRALILDMDGVIWRGSEPIGDLPAIFQQISRNHWKVILATNNSTRTINQYINRMSELEVDIQPWQIVTSSQAAAEYLREMFPQGGAVYIIGEHGLQEALKDHNFYHTEKSVLAVVVGMDRMLTFEKLRQATLLIRAGVPFIATNPDRTFPTPEGLIPGAGAILAALEASTYVRPFIAGKPSPKMYKIALERLGTLPSQTLVIGDRPETDIAGAQILGCKSALVLSGVVNLEQAQAWLPSPDLIIQDLSTLVNMTQS